MNVILRFTSSGLFLGGWPEGVDPRIPGTKCIQSDGKLVSPVPGIHVEESVARGTNICISTEEPDRDFEIAANVVDELREQLAAEIETRQNALSRLDDFTGDLADAEGTIEDIERIIKDLESEPMTFEAAWEAIKNIKEAI